MLSFFGLVSTSQFIYILQFVDYYVLVVRQPPAPTICVMCKQEILTTWLCWFKPKVGMIMALMVWYCNVFHGSCCAYCIVIGKCLFACCLQGGSFLICCIKLIFSIILFLLDKMLSSWCQHVAVIMWFLFLFFNFSSAAQKKGHLDVLYAINILYVLCVIWKIPGSLLLPFMVILCIVNPCNYTPDTWFGVILILLCFSINQIV